MNCVKRQTALQHLPTAQRQVITLFYIADYSQKEIATFLDLPLTTVKKRLYDAKQRLKVRMIEMAQDYLHEQRPSRDAQFQNQVLAIIAPAQATHGEAIYALFEVAEQPDGFQWRAGRLAHSHMDWQSSRIATLHPTGQTAADVIAAMHVYDITVRVGTARVRAAGFNCEVTHPDHTDQRPALIERMVNASLAAMREAGYDLAISFDDEVFWLGQGFVLGWRALQWRVAVADLPVAPVALQLQRFAPVHREDLAQLYNASHATLTGTTERPTYLRNKHPGMFMGWYWTDDQGKPAGYISGGADRYFTLAAAFQADLDRGLLSEALRRRFVEGSQWENYPLSANARCTVQQMGSQWLIEDGERKCYIYKEGNQLQAVVFDRPLFWVDEVAGDPALCLQALAQLARQWQCTELFFDRLHYQSGVGKRLRQLVSCRIHTGTFSRSPRSYVVRIINLQALVAKLTGELSRRLQDSPYATWQGNLLLVLEENGSTEEVLLAINNGVVTVAPVGETDHVIRSGPALAQLIVGSEAPAEIVEMTGIEVSGDAGKLLSVLFPAQWPQMGNQGL
ncbi:MAG: sigma-70 region 4 domain-containing protein [Caldilineaceae bacterium]